MSFNDLDSNQTSLHAFWLKLVEDLSPVQDAHYICSSIASSLAEFTVATCVIGLNDSQRDFFDVWICQPDGDIKQVRWSNERSSFQSILEAKNALTLNKLERPVSEILKSELWLLPKESILAIPYPFPADDNQASPPGVLCIIDPQENCPITDHELENLAKSMTIYLERAFLRRQLDQQKVQFAVVSDISQTLTSTLNMDDVFNQLTGTIRQILHVESLSVGLADELTGDIIFVGSLMGPLFDDLAQIRVKKGQGIAGWVAEHGEPVIINDTYADKRFYSGADHRSGFRTNSMICIPLRVEQKIIGVLQAINRQYGSFTDRDLRLLQATGAPLAAAIENANLHHNVLAEKRRVETILSSMSEGILTTTTTGQITRVNDAFGALVKDDPDLLLGQEINKVLILHDADLTPFIQEIIESEDEYPQMVGNLVQESNSFVPVLISGAPIHDEKEEVKELILTVSDLSQIREVERMREDLFQAIAHELRTPLATILMYARLLREGKARDQEKATRFLGVIERESDRLQRMVRRMMQLAKQNAQELYRSPQPIELNPLFDELLSPFADQATEKGLIFRQKIEPGLPLILGDQDDIAEIFGNLLVNAIKFTPTGSVSFSAKSNGDSVQIEVTDQGIGIPQEAIPNLFKRFYRAQTAVERGIAGTGLGLYMVKQSIEKYNGTIAVISTEGEGTTFTVFFPIYHN